MDEYVAKCRECGKRLKEGEDRIHNRQYPGHNEFIPINENE